MSELQAFVDSQIQALIERLRGYLGGQVTNREMAQAAWSVIDSWEALPRQVRAGEPVAHEDVLWHAVWTSQHLADAEHQGEGVTDPILQECLHLLESRLPLPQRYSAQRP